MAKLEALVRMAQNGKKYGELVSKAQNSKHVAHS